MWYKFKGQQMMMIGNKKIFVYSVDKEKELLQMNFEGIDTFIKMLDSLGKKSVGNAMILFDGYNHVTTELFEVPQVRKYVKELFDRYPHLLNYINFDLEGHHSLLACWLDLFTGYAGDKMTFDEHIKKFGIYTPMPKFNIRLNMPNQLLEKTTKAMLEHGRKIKALKNAESQAYKFRSIFKRAI